MKRIVTLIVLIAGLALAGCGSSTKTVAQTVTAPAETTTVTSTTTAPATRTHVITTKRTVVVTRTVKVPYTGGATIPGTGTFLVGKDIQPGQYHANASPGCYWKREKSPVGSTDSIIANDNADGPVVVDILPSDAAFTSQGCAEFHKIG